MSAQAFTDSMAMEVLKGVRKPAHRQAFTIGTGAFKPLAEMAAKRMLDHLIGDWEVSILSDQHQGEIPHPYLMKWFAFDFFPTAEWILYFDADVCCVKDWQPLLDATAPFYAVLDDFVPDVVQECWQNNMSHSDYFNAGLFLIHKSCRHVLERAKQIGPIGKMIDQGPINMAVQELKIPRRFWPQEFSFRVPPNQEIIRNIGKCKTIKIDSNGVPLRNANREDIINYHWYGFGSDVQSRIEAFNAV